MSYIKRENGKPYEPMAGSRASILSWDLTVKFPVKEQMQEFVRLLNESDLMLSFTVETVLGELKEYYVVTINETPWANNLTVISKMLASCDYSSTEEYKPEEDE